jgi:hypothetical protein
METIVLNFNNIAPIVIVSLTLIIISAGIILGLVEGISRLIVKYKP